jgi:metallo-beta-lactamase class B
LEYKSARAATEGVKAWVDPDGYRRRIVEQSANFEKLVAQESTGGRSRTAP